MARNARLFKYIVIQRRTYSTPIQPCTTFENVLAIRIYFAFSPRVRRKNVGKSKYRLRCYISNYTDIGSRCSPRVVFCAFARFGVHVLISYVFTPASALYSCFFRKKKNKKPPPLLRADVGCNVCITIQHWTGSAQAFFIAFGCLR